MANPESLKSEEDRLADERELAERLAQFDEETKKQTIGNTLEGSGMKAITEALRKSIADEARASERKKFYSEDDSAEANSRHTGNTEYLIPEEKREK